MRGIQLLVFLGLVVPGLVGLLGGVPPAGAGFDLGIDPGIGLSMNERHRGVALQVPVQARASIVMRDDKGMMEGSFGLVAGPVFGESSPRHVVGLILNSETNVEDSGCMGLECLILLHTGVMYEVTGANRFGLTAGYPVRFWKSEQWSSRLGVAFSWMLKNSRAPAMGVISVTFGPSFLAEGR